MLHIIVILFAISNSAYVTQSIKSHPITTLINAKWNQTPLYLEIAEYLADENPSLYWEFIEKIGVLDVSLADIELDSNKYIKSIDIAEDLLGARKVSLLKLALSMHTLTPRIQTYIQIAKPLFEKAGCTDSNFAVINNEVICSLEELTSEIKESISKEIETYVFDHIYPGSANKSLSVVLYGDIGSSKFFSFHKFLKEEANKRNVQYISRHFLNNKFEKKVRLSGYGVELHLKSTEYKSQDDSPRVQDETNNLDETEAVVDGFDFQFLKLHHSELENSLQRFRSSLLEKSGELAPLKAWEFQDLGLQAAQRIAEIQGEESLNVLQHIVQNFPTQAKSLVLQKVSSNFKTEMKHNVEVFGRSLNLQPPDAALFVNGHFFDVDTLDLGALVETLRTEVRVLDSLHNNNIGGKLASSLLALDLSSSTTKEFAIDIRDSAIMWINDIENDVQYRRWPSSVMDLLRPTFPGMLRNIRKNVFNLVLVIDPLTSNSRGLLKLSESFIIHLAPIRVGLVFDSRNVNQISEDSYRTMFCAFNYVTQTKDPRTALSFLTDIYATVKTDITSKDIKLQLKKSFNMLTLDEIEDIIGEDSDYDYGRKLSKDFIERLNFRNSPQALLNGVPIQQNVLNVDDFEEAVFTEVMQQTPILQKSVYRGDLNDADIPIDFLMDQPHVMPRLNQRILSTDSPKFLDFSGIAHDINNIKMLAQLNNRDMTATLLENLKYFNSKHSVSLLGKNIHVLTIWVYADLNIESGKNLLLNALQYMNSARNVRVGFIPNVEGQAVSKSNNINRLIWAASQSLIGVEATNYAINMLEKDANVDIPIPTVVNEILSSTELHLKMLRIYSQRVLDLKPSETAIVANGKIYGPLLMDETFTIDDFGLIERCNNLNYVEKIVDVIKASTEDLDINSDVLLKLFASLVPLQSKNRFAIPSDTKQNYTVVKLEPKKTDEPFFNIVAILDPASRGAQKLAPFLILLRNVINCNMRIYFCAVEQHSDMPVKNFYRFVVEPEVQFNPDGSLMSGPIAKFTNLPATSLLTQNLQVPENWLVEPVRSVYDLDNIKLIDVGGPVHSEFELEYLLLEGHCFDSNTGAPPRGLQITLGTNKNPTMMDTIVMANLGYFQVKANPGIWELRLRQGKSFDIYDIISAEGPNTVFQNNTAKIILSSLRSHVIKLKVNKKAEMSKVDLLGDETDSSSGIWNSLTSSFGGGKDTTESETINIFSVASGHLYERLLRIMMLSVLKHTKAPLKFWFLKNYLSPQFTDFLPAMSKKYNFQFELVQYKWPRWLHQQTEKQRTIWGYKILFLDVLFPLDVKKIIFVDADAIVRADIKELNDLDLNDAPYAYTPFCDSRKEMEGFRFWKQGYWRNHLMGRRYHISAIYVVDLKRFRKIAAGDRLRGQYQALSQDPNSLSNLDQDLPNNMIHQVAIKSLPDEWLWCQTWCSDDSFKKAKVIDLCNNPLTKEAKLTAAQRIVPEWKSYDVEIKNLMSSVLDHEMDHQENNDFVNNNDKIKHSEL